MYPYFLHTLSCTIAAGVMRHVAYAGYIIISEIMFSLNNALYIFYITCIGYYIINMCIYIIYRKQVDCRCIFIDQYYNK